MNESTDAELSDTNRIELHRPRERPVSTHLRDRHLLLAAAFARSTGTSLVGVLLGIHLAQIGFAPAAIGVVAGAGLGGAALGVATVTVWGERLGRRRCLLASALLGASGSALLIFGTRLPAVALAAFLGMVNAMGRDRGVALVVEQATLPTTVEDEARTRAFAWYGALQDAGHALGSLMAGAPSLLSDSSWLSETAANRVGLATLPVLLLATIGLYAALSPAVEVDGGRSKPRLKTLSPTTRAILGQMSALFALDGLGGGLLLTSLVSYFFFERFAAPPSAVALLFFAARLINILSNFAAAALARRIGLVNTMVFTHLPSSLLLIGVASVPSFSGAAVLFLLREVVAKMDVPTRQSYVMAVVEPEARVVASGVTSIVRLASWAIGPVIAGLLMQTVALAAPLLIGAGLKIAYDLLLYRAFRHRRPPEERP